MSVFERENESNKEKLWASKITTDKELDDENKNRLEIIKICIEKIHESGCDGVMVFAEKDNNMWSVGRLTRRVVREMFVSLYKELPITDQLMIALECSRLRGNLADKIDG
jgi:hypothetical protein